MMRHPPRSIQTGLRQGSGDGGGDSVLRWRRSRVAMSMSTILTRVEVLCTENPQCWAQDNAGRPP